MIDDNDWLKIKWQTIPDFDSAWIKLWRQAEETGNKDMATGLLFTAFDNGRQGDPRTVRFIMEMASWQVVFRQHVPDCPECRDHSGFRYEDRQWNCPVREIHDKAMRSFLLGFLKDRRKHTDPWPSWAVAFEADPSLLPEVLAHLNANAGAFSSLAKGSFKDIVQRFLNEVMRRLRELRASQKAQQLGLFKELRGQAFDEAVLLEVMIRFELHEEINGVHGTDDAPMIAALKRVYRRNDHEGSAPTSSKEALNSSDDVTRRAAERYVILRDKAVWRRPRGGGMGDDA